MKRFLIVLLFAAACFAQSTEQTLIELQKAAATAQTKKDADFFRRTLTDDYLSIGSGGDSGHKADLVEGISESDITGIQLYNFKFVPIDENSAILAYDAVIHRPRHNVGARRYQHVSSIWVKQGDTWKLKFQQATPNEWSYGDFD
ncbi:MAG TPA: nuclear transport factor 2 family protein [Terriglobales bacterium]|nr:nuclear transport factor 2 family protein [Terriglobales bacterium]